MPKHRSDAEAWQLAIANEGLAYSQARQICKLYPYLEADDLKSEALLALHTAALYFDPVGTAKFSTYAVVSIKRRLWRHCAAAARWRQGAQDGRDEPTAVDELHAPEVEPALDVLDEDRAELEATAAVLPSVPEPARTALRLWLGIGETPHTIGAVASRMRTRPHKVIAMLAQAIGVRVAA